MPSCILNEVLATPTSLSHSSPSSAEGQQLCALLAGHLLNLDGNGALVVVSGVAIIEKVHVQRLQAYFSPVGPVQGFCAKPIVARGGLAEQRTNRAKVAEYARKREAAAATSRLSLNRKVQPN